MNKLFWPVLLAVSLLVSSGSSISTVVADSRLRQIASAIPTVLPDATSDRVLGQAAFSTNGYGTSANSLWLPAGIAIAPPGSVEPGRLFVVEYGYYEDNMEKGNHRVLSWPSVNSFVSGQNADLVIGQENFTTQGGGLAQDRFYGPEAAVVGADGGLWVADTINHRVLRFDPPFTNGMDASLVLGQPDFNHSKPNQDPAGVGDVAAANTLFYPRGLAMDTAGNLYVADDFNHRVLRFSPPFKQNMDASLVIGQANFFDNDPNRGANPRRNTLNSPKGIAVDSAGNLYIAEFYNNRVTRYTPPLMTGMNASQVFGQLDFLHTDPNRDPNQVGDSPASNTLYHPIDLAVSSAGNALFVTDQGNLRLLGYLNPLNDMGSDAFADQVYGQPDFFTYPPNTGVSQNLISWEPLGVAVDSNGSLYHADFRNNRLLAFDVEVVGDGTPTSCNEAALDAALFGGGTIVLNCGTAQINLNNTKSIFFDTILDGGDSVTLSGQNAYQLFYVDAGNSLQLQHIVLTEGYSEGDGGAILNNGTLILENSTLRNSTSALSGGGIVSYGPLTIRNSLLEGNQALNGGALYPRWGGAVTTIENSILRDNHATDAVGWGGSILAWDGAPVRITDSVVSGNTANNGGGIYNFQNSALILDGNTRLEGNEAGFGGGLYNAGGLIAGLATIGGNSATVSGGGIYNADTGNVTLSVVTFDGNSAGYGGGIYNDIGTALLGDITFTGNTASVNGGGLANHGTASIELTTFYDNSAGERGGGLYNIGSASLTNTTISGNSVLKVNGEGGGLYNSGITTLVNATLSGNTADGGGGIFNSSDYFSLINSIITNSPKGGNCDGVDSTPISTDLYSISSDATCALVGIGSLNKVNPMLTQLGNYGGVTQVHKPLPGSPAIDLVEGNCPPPYIDQRGMNRPEDGDRDGALLCDTGAVEVTASDLLFVVYLPVEIK